MTNSQHHGRRAARHVIALVAVILELSRTDVEYIYHSLNRSLPATKMEMKRHLCLETVRRFLAAPGEKKTQEAFRAWRRSREADGQPEMSERQIRETLGAWDDAKAKAAPEGDGVLDPTVPRLRRSATAIRVTPERAERALEQWVRDVPGGIRNNSAYTRWARAANDELASTTEPLHPVTPAPVLAAVDAADMAEAVKRWDPEAATRPQAYGASLNAKDHRPREWLAEDLKRCNRYYKRPFTRSEYKLWAEEHWEPDGTNDRKPVSVSTITRRARSFCDTARLLELGDLVTQRGTGGERWPDRRLAEFLGRVVGRCVLELDHTVPKQRHWWAEREAAGGPTLAPLTTRRRKLPELAFELLERYPEHLPEGVTIERMKEDRR